jgi:hypothetical protein
MNNRTMDMKRGRIAKALGMPWIPVEPRRSASVSGRHVIYIKQMPCMFVSATAERVSRGQGPRQASG